LPSLSIDEAWLRRAEGWPKLCLIQRVLRRRAQQPGLLAGATAYRPLPARGAGSQHVVAFARGDAAVTVVPRLVLGLRGDWADTSLDLPPGHWHNELTGEDLDGGPAGLGAILRRFPVAWLTRKEAAA
jgi:(1->4)-alpha-D-glucan 1-alpha-D-glucosylmutase